MTSDDRTPKEIERELEKERSDLTSNIEDLQEKFSIDTLVRQVSDQFREHGGDLGQSVLSQVKANPIPLALTGIGLAWLMVSGSDRQQSNGDRERFGSDRPDQKRHLEDLRSQRDYRQERNVRDERNSPAWARTGPTPFRDLGDQTDTGITDRAEEGTTGPVGSAAAGVRDGLSSATTNAADRVGTARDRLYEGTETLSEEGRQRVLSARRKAVELRQSAGTSARQGADAAQDFFENQPLVAGALALAVGAAIGGAMPRTDAEDEFMGRQSDDLIGEAERIFEEEKAKAMNVADAVGSEVGDIVAETKSDLDDSAPGDQNAIEAVGSKVETSADRIADRASDEARKQNLGEPKT